MALVVLLIACMVRRRLDNRNAMFSDDLWQRWFQVFSKMKSGGELPALTGVLLVLVPALLSALAIYTLKTFQWQVIAYVLEAFVLVLLMGVPGWRHSLESYAQAWQRGDMQAAWHHIRECLPARERDTASTPELMHLALSKAMLLTVFRRYFLVAFGYVVGGVGLAVFVRGLVALTEQWPNLDVRAKYATLAEWVSWIPVRVLSITFGIAGDLSGWLREVRPAIMSPGKTTEDILIESANAALSGYALDPGKFSAVHPDEWTRFGGRSLRAVRDLLSRSMLVWICGLALLVIAGVI